MQPEQSAQLEHILGRMSVGVAILDCLDLRVRYVNTYLLSLLEKVGHTEDVTGCPVHEVLPPDVLTVALPVLKEACATCQKMCWPEIAYEGFLVSRGRTYWRVCLECMETTDDDPRTHSLFITIEDVTELSRSRLYLDAIHYISSAIAGPYSLPRVLDRILESVQELVGSNRCAVLLLDTSIADIDARIAGLEGQFYTHGHVQTDKPPRVTIAAQRGIHLRSRNWHPQVSSRVLLGRAMNERRPIILTDTSIEPAMEFPLINDSGNPRRPGSVLCVPIFEPTSDPNVSSSTSSGKLSATPHTGTVLGTIEVYHRRKRGFPAEEVDLLEQFAQQAGLAIQNARLFRGIGALARDASRNARQRQNVMQAIPDGVIIYDSRWRVADVNQAIRNLLGWTEDVIGLSITEALARSTATFEPDFPPTQNLIEELDSRALHHQIDEVKLTAADGKSYTIRRSYAPIHDELGNIFAYVVIYHDVTEQALARERIEAEVIERTRELAQRNMALQLAQATQELEHARLELLLERLPSGVMLITASTRQITLMNHQAVQLLQTIGLALEPADDPTAAAKNAIGKDVEELLRPLVVYSPHGTPVEYDDRPLGLALRKGEASEAELHAILADEQKFFLLVSAAPLRAADGSITSVVLVLHDLTRLKTLERAREDFFTTMAHELKTPLANIRAHLSALQAQDLQWSAEEQRDFLQTADEQVERLVRMINHFLDASRVEAGALRLEFEPIFIPELFEDLQERLEALITSSSRHLKIVLPPEVPPVEADYELIMSVLTNLLSNAFRYAPEGDDVLLKVEPVHEKDSSCITGVKISVSDKGPGLSLEQQAALFTRFSTFAAIRRPTIDRPGQPPVTQKRRGNPRWSAASGLGLYISRGIIEAHGSQLKLRSSPGKGATFSFTLKVAHSYDEEIG